jgi:hypothetical protein
MPLAMPAPSPCACAFYSAPSANNNGTFYYTKIDDMSSNNGLFGLFKSKSTSKKSNKSIPSAFPEAGQSASTPSRASNPFLQTSQPTRRPSTKL